MRFPSEGALGAAAVGKCPLARTGQDLREGRPERPRPVRGRQGDDWEGLGQAAGGRH